MTQIIKVILKDGSSIHSDFFIDGLSDTRFQRKILNKLDKWDIEDYAKDNLDLVHEDDVESDINDFSNGEILSEANNRGLLATGANDIVKDDLAKRFASVLKVASQFELEEIINQLEIKHKLK